MGFCSSTCTDKAVMTNKNVVGEIREVMGNLMEMLNTMDSAEREPTFQEKLHDWTKFQFNLCSKERVVEALHYTCQVDDHKLLDWLRFERRLNDYQDEAMKLVAPSRKYAAALIKVVDDPLGLALSHPRLSMVKYMCMLTNRHGMEIPCEKDVPNHVDLLFKFMLDAIEWEDLPSLRYFHSWISEYAAMSLCSEMELVQAALCNINLGIIKYMRDVMEINFHKAWKVIDFKVYPNNFWVDRRTSSNGTHFHCCLQEKVWDLLCVLHELMYPNFDTFIVRLILGGRVQLVMKAFKCGIISKTKMAKFMGMHPLVFFDFFTKA